MDIKKIVDVVGDKAKDIDFKAVGEAVDVKKVAEDIKKDGFDLSDIPVKDVMNAIKKNK